MTKTFAPSAQAEKITELTRAGRTIGGFVERFASLDESGEPVGPALWHATFGRRRGAAFVWLTGLASGPASLRRSTTKIDRWRARDKAIRDRARAA